MARVVIPGSERRLVAEHPLVGEVDRGKTISVTGYLRGSGSLDWGAEEAGRAPAQRRTVSRSELGRLVGSSDEDVAAVRSFAEESGLEVSEVEPGRRAVTLRGTVDAVAQAFGVQSLGLYQHPSGVSYRGREGSLTVPDELDGVITGVFGIDERPQARPYIRPQ